MVGVLHAVTAGSAASTPIQRVAGFTGSALTSGVTSVSCTGLTVGDLIIACGGAAQSTEPTISSGWTKITAVGNSGRRLVVAYRIASSTSHSITFTGSDNTAGTSSNYSSASVFRGATAIGAFNSTSPGNTSSTIASPSLTLSRPPSALFLATYVAAITTAPGGMTVANGHAYVTSTPSWGGGDFTTSSSIQSQSVIVEIY